ncbi:MAG: hypothetical protein EZS28_012964 [Streblomastix strix]|uniref:Uncharacterized protein n=1 Tax=Streblomastix strix TaxID=222440 RepID=A0A5J4W9B7_9EUKA|nr:MAG: hypothetical protein EZS28_012964 [Streblomastix strix]
MKNNYAAILELIDEIFDYKDIQTTNTDDIKSFIKSDMRGAKTMLKQITVKISKIRNVFPYQLLSSAELKLGFLQNVRTSEQFQNQSSSTSSPFKQPISQSGTKTKSKSSSSFNNDNNRCQDIRSLVQVHINLKEISKHILEILIRLIPKLHESNSILSITRFLCIIPVPVSVVNVSFQPQQKNVEFNQLDKLSSGDGDLSDLQSNPQIGEMCHYRSEERQLIWQAATFHSGEEHRVITALISNPSNKRSISMVACVEVESAFFALSYIQYAEVQQNESCIQDPSLHFYLNTSALQLVRILFKSSLHK